MREIEFRGIPENKLMAGRAVCLANTYYPEIAAVLGSAPAALKPFKLIFRKSLKTKDVAITGGRANVRKSTIELPVAWLAGHPAYFDFAMLHEMTHLVEGYKWSKAPGYWNEGMANYAPCKMGFGQGYVYPNANFFWPHYTSGYNGAAAFLLHLDSRYGIRVVRALNAALREGTYSEALFPRLTGHSLAELWSDFEATAAYTAPAAITNEVRRRLELGEREPQWLVRRRFERFLKKRFNAREIAALHSQLGYVKGRAPLNVDEKYAEHIYSRSIDGALTTSALNYFSKSVKARKIPWLNKRYYFRAEQAGQLPWLADHDAKKGLPFEISLLGEKRFSGTFPVTRTFFATNPGQALFFYFTLELPSPNSLWRLKRAWIARTDGSVVEQYRGRGT